MESKPSNLWRHSNFLKMWSGETISLFGTQVSSLAIPLTAIIFLQATPLEMGFLSAAQFAPLLLISLFAGVWVDRLSRRLIMILADFGQALLLILVPFAYFLSVLTMGLLYVIAFLTGTLSVFFAVAYQSYLPSLIDKEQLTEGNAKLEASQSLAEVAGPALAGGFVQILSAPIAIIVDALSFVVSGFCLLLINGSEVVHTSYDKAINSIWVEIIQGLRYLLGNPLLRAFALCNATTNFFSTIIIAVYTVYLVRDLNINATLLGLVLAAGGIGGIIGATISGKMVKWLGFGRILVLASFVAGVVWFLTPLASGSDFVFIITLLINRFSYGLANPIYRVSQVSVRQAIVPHHLQGRVNASMRFLAGGVVPFGALAGGFLGTILGLRLTLVFGALGMTSAFLWLFFSPVRKLNESLDQAALILASQTPS